MTASTLLVALSSLLPAVVPSAPLPAGGAPVLRLVWEQPLAAARGANLQACTAAAGRLLVPDAAGGITALDPASGAVLWFVQAPGPVENFVPSDGGAIAFASGTSVLAIDGATGRRLFEKRSASSAAFSPCSDGRLVYVPALLNNMLVAWDIAEDIRAWEFHMPAPFAGPAVLSGEAGSASVVFCTEDGVLRAVPAQAAVPAGERWTQRVGRVVGAPVVAGPVIVLASGDRTVMALDAASGVVRWKRFTGDPPRSQPVLVSGRVVVQTVAGLTALDLATGATVWEQSGSARPLGEVGGELLVRATGAGGCEWREIATGRLLQAGLPANCVAAGGMAIELRGGAIVAGWKRSEH